MPPHWARVVDGPIQIGQRLADDRSSPKDDSDLELVHPIGVLPQLTTAEMLSLRPLDIARPRW
jgi:hypothetical protein